MPYRFSLALVAIGLAACSRQSVAAAPGRPPQRASRLPVLRHLPVARPHANSHQRLYQRRVCGHARWPADLYL